MYAGNSFSRRRSEGWVENVDTSGSFSKIRPEVDEKAKEKSAGCPSEKPYELDSTLRRRLASVPEARTRCGAPSRCRS
jgi:hypothetical protein